MYMDGKPYYIDENGEKKFYDEESHFDDQTDRETFLAKQKETHCLGKFCPSIWNILPGEENEVLPCLIPCVITFLFPILGQFEASNVWNIQILVIGFALLYWNYDQNQSSAEEGQEQQDRPTSKKRSQTVLVFLFQQVGALQGDLCETQLGESQNYNIFPWVQILGSIAVACIAYSLADKDGLGGQKDPEKDNTVNWTKVVVPVLSFLAGLLPTFYINHLKNTTYKGKNTYGTSGNKQYFDTWEGRRDEALLNLGGLGIVGQLLQAYFFVYKYRCCCPNKDKSSETTPQDEVTGETTPETTSKVDLDRVHRVTQDEVLSIVIVPSSEAVVRISQFSEVMMI